MTDASPGEKGEAMTVDNDLFNEIIGELEVVASVTARTRAMNIIRRIRRAEAERCAAECNRLGDRYVTEGHPGIASGCYRCHDAILRTSPGKET